MIPHNKPTLGKEELAAVADVLSCGRLAQGYEVEAFENELCAFLGYDVGHAIALSSGSAALYMAIRGVSAEKKVNTVAIPAYSCSALKNAVMLSNASPIYVDTKNDSPNIDLDSRLIEEADVTIAAHMFGMPMNIRGNAIEDCAQSIGAVVDDNSVGTQTPISVFSFYATKPITSGGEGGMVVSKDTEIIKELKDLRDFDMKNDDKLRFNFQMTDLQAAIGRVQLQKLGSLINRRHYLADRYCDKGVPLWNRSKGGIDYRGIIKSKNPWKLIKYLSERKIAAIIPIIDSELLCDKEHVPNSYQLTQSLVSVPLYPSLTDNDQDYIISTILSYVDKEGYI